MSMMPDLARHLESTLLKATALPAEIDALCGEAIELGCLGVCVASAWVERAGRCLAHTPVSLVAVAGFPLGNSAPAAKVAEARYCLEHGATEVDIVLNQGLALAGEWAAAEADIAQVAQVVHQAGGRLKVILELGNLSEEQKVSACRCAVTAGADFVKTSTGFGPSGATLADVQLLRSLAPASVGVKAAGGIRDRATAEAMIAAGADRIGTSSAWAILTPG